MLLMISLTKLTVGVRLWNSKFVMHSMLLDASAYLLQSLSVVRNRRLLMRRKQLFRLNISRHTPGLTGRGFPYLSLSHQPLKNRNGPSFSTVAHTPRFRRFPLWAGFSDISFERPKRRDVLRCQQGSDSKSLGHSLSRSAPRPASAQNDSIIFAAMRFAGLISFAPVFQKIRRVPSIAGAVNRTCQSFRPGRGGCRQNFRVVQRVGMSNFRSFTSAPLAQLAEQVTLNHWVAGSIPARCIIFA